MDTGHDKIFLKEKSSIKYLFIDYEGLDADEMVKLIDQVIVLSAERKLPFIANFKNTKITNAYLRKSNEWINVTRAIIPFGAFIGLDLTKSLLLESYLKLNGLNHRHFDSYEEAEDALVSFYIRKE
jgi:hypothetical protein